MNKHNVPESTSIEALFGNLFKPEVKSSGRKLIAQEKVSLSAQSDTDIQAYVRVAPPFKVTLTSENIASPSFTADCTCPAAKKNRFCKHIWATLLCAEESCPDFLSNKREINKAEATFSEENQSKPTYQAAAKERASEYRKEQYQKSKLRTQEKKNSQKKRESATSLKSFTPEIEDALAYFLLNGFPMPEGPTLEIITEAKRTLSRVFHPDKGGSHEESVELNRNCEVLLGFLR